jgi:hypothetical protein
MIPQMMELPMGLRARLFLFVPLSVLKTSRRRHIQRIFAFDDTPSTCSEPLTRGVSDAR